MKIIDTHQHLWDMDLFSFSWCKAEPRLNHSFRMADYVEASRGLGIEKTVHLEADVDEPFMLEETRYILKLAENPDNPLTGVVACGRPEKEGFSEYLDQIAGHPALKGIRRVLHTQPDTLGQGRTFIENVKSLGPHHLSFDICVLPRQLPVAINLVKQCPAVTFILDHCGDPLIKEKQMDPWRERIRELARFPNVNCKISGLVTQADATSWSADDLRPYIDHVIACFGWDHVMFGSDWPVCTLASTLKRWVETLLTITRNESEQNRHKLFYENARRVYRLGDAL